MEKQKKIIVKDNRAKTASDVQAFKILGIENDTSYVVGDYLTLKELEKNFIKPPWWKVVIK